MAEHRMIATPGMWAAARIEKGYIADFDKHVYFDEKKAELRAARLQSLENEAAELDRKGGHERPKKSPWEAMRVFGYLEATTNAED